MTDRLQPLDVSFLYLEGPTTPMHVGGLAVFEPPAEGFDYERFAELVEHRLSLVPRYRQKIKSVPGHLASPVWVDDPEFDLGYHVRRSALPRPGSDDQLRELVARVQSRPLDRHRPLWEMYLVEGLADGRFAVIQKTHYALVDGVNAVDIGQVILDSTPVPRALPEDLWMPRREPAAVELLAGAVGELIRRPTAVADTVRLGLADARSVATKLTSSVGDVLTAARVAARPAPNSPLNGEIGSQRRFAVARTELADYRKVRRQVGGTVNDVVLATVAGAIRGWLLSRGEAVRPASAVRAMVPVSVRPDDESGQVGSRVSSYLVDLPVGEPNPIVRLSQVSYAMQAHKESGQSVSADALTALSGFAPPTLHALGARAASSFTRRLFNLVVTNVPGPQFPLYASGARMLEMFPVIPLAARQALSIGLTSYDGGVYFGLNADRDHMHDVDVLASLIEESLAELVLATDGGRGR
ncbi:MAG TPA: wax ester/triacylglycerol synthase family O-acyltransferase [Jatrophihabitans sp.]|nr:wax ester/triacylglycerol synthase family O-acyltransferase [Jatrophihabitans sp.]